MKKLILIISTILILGISEAQNEMYCTITELSDSGLILTEKLIDITYIKDSSLVNARLADSIINYLFMPYTRSLDNDYRIILREFGINSNWGATMTTALALGDYSSYYSSYADTIMTNFFGCIHSDSPDKKELEIRLRHELNGTMASMVDSFCIGYGANGIVVGTLTTDYNLSNSMAYLVNKSGYVAFIVDYYTVTFATDEEINEYY